MKIKIIEYEDKYLENVRDLLVELEEYLVNIDLDHLDMIGKDYREKMAIYDLNVASDNNGKVFIALDNNKVIGLIIGIERKYDNSDYLDYKCPKMGIITELIVSKDARKKGIGNLLINRLETYFKSIACKYISVEVFAYNETANNFYKNIGFHNRMHTMIKII